MDVGVQINKYKVVEHIGRGGMADVWSARDTVLNRMVAIKTIAHGLSQELDPVGLFNREARTIANMEHPHVLPIYDFGEFEGQLYIVMRYVAGGSLEDVLNRGAMPLDEGMRMGYAIAEALDYAHSNDIIHLDLKPPNVLLDSQHAPYLADFGLATKLDPQGKANNPGSGTLLYMAPEQLTAEVIDKRADIYSFGVMMYHVFTGELPFQGSAPMALKQLQFQEELPELDEINASVPHQFTDVLRLATSINPGERPATLTGIMEQLSSIVAGSTGIVIGGLQVDDDVPRPEIYDLIAKTEGDIDMELLEAVEIYSRARHNWSGGNGRFLLGVTNFLVMNGYYMHAEQHGLQLDTEGKQMLLRGALEYDQEVDYWWSQLDDENRRWVCFHALRSGNAPARVRALYRLETLRDSAEAPQIPKFVAQTLQIENNREARLAALQVLGTRAKLMKRPQQYDIKTEYRGRMLTTMTRLGIQINPPTEWLEVVYSPEIDLLLAETALDYAMPEVAEFAARVVGRIRSTTAVRYIVKQREQGRRGALRALALVRDEAPSLPEPVGTVDRTYAWLANTFRRAVHQPMGLVFRYVAAALAGWLAMGFHLYNITSGLQLLTQNRWINILAVGLMFAFPVGFAPLFAGELPARLRHFWPMWGRVLLSLIGGTLFGMLAWWTFVWAFNNQNPVDWTLLLFAGVMLALGYTLKSTLRFGNWLAIPLTAVLTWIPIYLAFQTAELFMPVQFLGLTFEVQTFQHGLLVYDVFEPGNSIRAVGLVFAFILAIGGVMPSLVHEISGIVRTMRRRRAEEQPLVLPTVPNVAEYVPAETLADMRTRRTELETQPDVRQAAEIDTELDLAMNKDNKKTEVDMNLGIQGEPDLEPPQAARDPDGMKTEVDLRAGTVADDDEDATEEEAMSSFTPPVQPNDGMKTEVDPLAGTVKPDDEDATEEEAASPFASTGNKSDDVKTESLSPFAQKINAVLDSEEGDAEEEEVSPFAPTGIRGDEVKTEIKVGQETTEDDEAAEPKSPFAGMGRQAKPDENKAVDPTTQTERDVTRRTVKMDSSEFQKATEGRGDDDDQDDDDD